MSQDHDLDPQGLCRRCDVQDPPLRPCHGPAIPPRQGQRRSADWHPCLEGQHLRACIEEHHGTDREGRCYAAAALDRLCAALAALPPAADLLRCSRCDRLDLGAPGGTCSACVAEGAPRPGLMEACPATALRDARRREIGRCEDYAEEVRQQEGLRERLEGLAAQCDRDARTFGSIGLSGVAAKIRSLAGCAGRGGGGASRAP